LFLIVGEPLNTNECIGGAVVMIIAAVLLAGADSILARDTGQIKKGLKQTIYDKHIIIKHSCYR
jgi:hypothetical protein